MTAPSGKAAVANGHDVGSYSTGMCQQFVRGQCWQVPSLYGSAIEAWNGARYKHPGDRTPPVGAPTYYRGGQYGHAVIFCGQGHPGIRSTDCQSSGRVSDTDIGWPERAWGYSYLGWTEDINGVRVITGDDTGDTGGSGEDEMPEYLSAKRASANVGSGSWKILEWSDVISDSRGNALVEGEGGIRIGGRRYTSTLSLTASVSGERIMTRTTESEPDGHGGYELAETNPAVEHVVTAGDTLLQDTRSGSVGKDRRLRWEVYLPSSGQVSAELVVLYW